MYYPLHSPICNIEISIIFFIFLRDTKQFKYMPGDDKFNFQIQAMLKKTIQKKVSKLNQWYNFSQD